MAEKCFRCGIEAPNLVRARREVKTYSGESNYIYILACLDCFETMDRRGLEVLGDDGEPLELDKVTWQQGRLCDSPPTPAVKPEQMTLDQAGQLDLFKEGT